MRFPFTFLGFMSLGIAIWAGLYLFTHPAIELVSRAMILGTGALAMAFGGFVLVRRLRHGSQG